MENWNPWYGCHKCSRGCEHCYVENLNKLYDKDFNEVKFSYGNFSKIDKKDEYRDFIIPAGTIINVCETSDFFLEEVYEWRVEAWKKIKNRDDLFFIINTRRVENIFDSLPSDWGDGYDNVAIVFNVSDQKTFDLNIENFLKLKIKHKRLNLCPILEKMNIIDYLDGI